MIISLLFYLKTGNFELWVFCIKTFRRILTGNPRLKGTVIVISRDPLCKDGYGRFTSILLKDILIKTVKDNVVFSDSKNV